MARVPPIPELDALLHEPARLRVLALLALVERADFMFVLRQTGLSKGNLYVQLKKLTAAELIGSDAVLDGRRARTVYSLTDAGREALRDYKRAMLALLEPFPD